MSKEAPILYFVALSPGDGDEATFNTWYDTEHLPELLACPGFLSAKRLELVDGEPGAPKYFAVYEMESMDAFDSPEYQALRARKIEDRTPIAQEVMAHRKLLLSGKYRETLRMPAE